MSQKKFIYLIQGKAKNVVKYQYLNTERSDVMMLSYDEEIENYEGMTLFLPKSYWAEGRNALFEKALSLDTDYLYYIICDDDVEFVKGGFTQLEEEILHHMPAVAVPSYRDSPFTLKLTNDNVTVQQTLMHDPQLEYMHRDVAKSRLVYPLCTDYDHLKAHISGLPGMYALQILYRDYMLQFNNHHTINTQHGDYSSGKTHYDLVKDLTVNFYSKIEHLLPRPYSFFERLYISTNPFICLSWQKKTTSFGLLKKCFFWGTQYAILYGNWILNHLGFNNKLHYKPQKTYTLKHEKEIAQELAEHRKMIKAKIDNQSYTIEN